MHLSSVTRCFRCLLLGRASTHLPRHQQHHPLQARDPRADPKAPSAALPGSHAGQGLDHAISLSNNNQDSSLGGNVSSRWAAVCMFASKNECPAKEWSGQWRLWLSIRRSL